jgi:DNA mismatch repair protein MutS
MDEARLTPAMRQYVEQKKRVGDAVLLFRMGDFYETFFEDAVLCSRVLGITLTSRNKDSNPIPLAGIPYHALEGYLAKLVAAGHRVAISEQMEDPKQAVGVIKRDVVRIVTAGTLTEDSLLAERDENILACLCLRGGKAGLATVELASGRLAVIDVSPDRLLDELVRIRPAEVLVDDERDSAAAAAAVALRDITGAVIARRPLHELSPYQAEVSLKDHFAVATLAGFGHETMTLSLCAAGAIIQYLRETQRNALAHITTIASQSSDEHVLIDHSTWRALEIDRTLRGGGREGSLLHAVDRTVHPIGARRLRQWLCAPLRDAREITRRQDAIGWLREGDAVRQRLRKRLRTMADMERIASRTAMARTTPRDLRGLALALATLPTIATEVEESRIALLCEMAESLRGLEDLAELLGRAIREEPAGGLREGGFIADGFDAELDRLRTLGVNGQQWLAEYQRREIERSGIAGLKVGFNRVFGYYIEITNAQRGEVPADFVRRQTVKNAERYITDELKKFESEVLTAQERANEREYDLFEQLRRTTAARCDAILKAADAIGRLDCVAGLAELAATRGYCRPELVEDGRLDIRDGRHPVLDQVLADSFVPNDTVFDPSDARLYVITGPNMAGKSTYIRQVALLTILAQTGSFVPARSMTLSLVDRVFARVGASDEIMRGQSTFMVEMTEAALILHSATANSLVVLDELGRGTSTFDGLSLAWAITEHLANEVRCRALVATHYHEMTELAELLKGVRNCNVAVREVPAEDGHDAGIVFLHRIVPGAASQSYGIHVARLAGVPKPVVRRSREILDELQRGFSRESKSPQLARGRTRQDGQLSLFTDPGEELLTALRATDPDKTSPLDALRKLQEWKERFG